MVEIYWYEISLKNKVKVITEHNPKSLIPSVSLLLAILLHIWRLDHLPKLHIKRIKI